MPVDWKNHTASFPESNWGPKVGYLVPLSGVSLVEGQPNQRDLEDDHQAHNPLSGIGSSNPTSAKWASAQQCAERSLVKVGGT